MPDLLIASSECLITLAAYEAIGCCPLLAARLARRLSEPMLLLPPLFLDWATIIYDRVMIFIK